MTDQDELEAVDARIAELTGERYHLYTSRPGDGQTRVVFTDGVKHGYGAGLAHARHFLIKMESPVPCDNTHMHGAHLWVQSSYPAPSGGATTGKQVGCRGVR